MVMGSIMRLFPLSNGVYLARKYSGNCNGVCRYVGGLVISVNIFDLISMMSIEIKMAQGSRWTELKNCQDVGGWFQMSKKVVLTSFMDGPEQRIR